MRDTFAPLGCTLQTSFADSFVSVEEYNVRGRSGQFCAATHEPLYQGTLTIRFCQPGDATAPAGVKYVGFWTAYVDPGGTALRAFDAHDRMIGEAKTVNRGRDFLALKSTTPIAYIKVVPIEEVDKDFAIDDLFFDPPAILADANDPQWSVVLTSAGERIKCRRFRPDGQKLKLTELSIGLPILEIPLTEVAAVLPPASGAAEPAAGDFSVLLSDGSTVRGKVDDGPKRLDGKPLKPEQLVALWSSDTAPMPPPEDAWPEAGGVLIDRSGHAKPLGDWRLGEQWIASAELEHYDHTYENTPAVWFRRPASPDPAAGLLRLTGGEEYVLSGKDGVRLQSWNETGVTIRIDDAEVTLPITRLRMLRLPE